jgi:hypothetical protein
MSKTLIISEGGLSRMNASAHSSISRFLVCIPHVLKAVLSKEDCCDISMEAEPYLCMDPSSLVLTELRG